MILNTDQVVFPGQLCFLIKILRLQKDQVLVLKDTGLLLNFQKYWKGRMDF